MARITVKLDIGDGKLRSLASQLRRLNRQLDHLYTQGQDNNNTISNRSLTNFQNQLGAFNQATSQKKQELSGDLQQAQLSGNTRLINRIVTEIDQLVEAQKASNQFFSSDKFRAVNNYKVSSNKTFAGSRWDQSNFEFKNDLAELSKDIGQFSNRVKILGNRWNTTTNSGVLTSERYRAYQNTADTLNNKSYAGRLNDLTQRYTNEQQSLNNRRAILQRRVENGTATRDDTTERAEIDEEINHLQKYTAELRRLTVTLNRTNESLSQTTQNINDATNTGIKILPPENSFRGLLRQHSAVIARTALAGEVASLGMATRIGDRMILNTFDNIKSVAYTRGGNDNSVMNQLENTGYSMGYDSEQMSKYLNAYTATTGNANLSNRQMNSLLSAWGGLSRYSGAKEQTTQNLARIVGLTSNYKSVSQNTNVAKAIQNEITNSGMSAKADEQQSALAGMLQIASNSAGGLTANEQKNIAGFQGLLARLGPEFQGQNGLQAYRGLVSSFNPQSIQARMIWGAQDPINRSQVGQAYLTEEMQKAPAHPYEYRKPIQNLLAHAATQSKSKTGQRHIAAADLMELSSNQLTPDQAEKLVKAYQENKLTKHRAQQIVKGNGKGQQDKYNMTSIKGRQRYYSAYRSMARKTSRDLNVLRGHLALINKIAPMLPMLSGFVGGVIGGLGNAGLLAVLHNPREAKEIAKGGAGAIRDIFKHTPKGGSGEAEHVASESSHFGAHSYRGKHGASESSRSREGSYRGKHGGYRAERRYQGKHARGRRKARRRISGRSKKMAGIAGLGLGLWAGTSDDTAEASTRGSKKDKSRKNDSRTLQVMQNRVKNNRKRLWFNEWELIRHLDTFWNVWLRHVKENAGNSKDDSEDDSGGDANDEKKSPEEWKADIKKAAKAMGVNVSDQQVDIIVSMIAAESGGDPGITQQISDINSARGDPAQGLLQFIPETFNTYAVKGHNNIKSGYDQLLALFNDSNWASDIHPGGGWGPTGNPRKSAIGGIRTHANGGIFNGASSTVATKVSSKMLNDLRTVNWMSRIRQSQNYIKIERKAPKFTVKVNVKQSARINKEQIINQVIRNEFNGWISRKQQKQLMDYFSNETSSLF